MRQVVCALLILALASPAAGALDSKNKRGSVISMTIPGRPWLCEPDGGFGRGDRLALALLAATVPMIPVILYYYKHGRRR